MSDLQEYTKQAMPITNPTEYVEWLNSIAPDTRVLSEERVDTAFVAGCSAPVWIAGNLNADRKLEFTFACDSRFVRGLGKILTDVYSNKTKEEVLQVKFRDFEHITKFLLFERKRSFQKFINKIYSIALSS